MDAQQLTLKGEDMYALLVRGVAGWTLVDEYPSWGEAESERQRKEAAREPWLTGTHYTITPTEES